MKMEQITIDNGTGSKELLPHFPGGIAELGYLEYADFAFLGNGENDEVVKVGIERKTITDMLNSMVTGRFSGHQLIGLTKSFNTVYLVIEGLWRVNEKTELLEQHKRGSWRTIKLGIRTFGSLDIWCYLNTISLKTNIIVVKTSNTFETVRFILALHHWWIHKKFDDHISHLQPQRPKFVRFHKPCRVHSVVEAIVPGIGFKKALEVGRNVNTVEDLVNRGIKELQEIKGIGKVLAGRIYDGLR